MLFNHNSVNSLLLKVKYSGSFGFVRAFFVGLLFVLEAVEEFELAPAPEFVEESPATADPFFLSSCSVNRLPCLCLIGYPSV